MTDFLLPYGHTHLTLSLPDERDVTLLAPPDVAPAADVAVAVRHALAHPLGAADPAMFARAQSVAIAIDSPPAVETLVPLLDALAEVGIPPQATTLLLAAGPRGPLSPDHAATPLPGDLRARYPVIDHDRESADLVYLGATGSGPVWANRHWLAADLRIAAGSIAPHPFLGFSGGGTSAAVGLAGRATLAAACARLDAPGARLGQVEGSPVRQAVDEIGQVMGVHLALDAVCNADGCIVDVLAGDPAAVLRAGIPLARQYAGVPVAAPFDLVIASPGGHPQDVDLLHAQPALARAALVTRDGGTVIVTAACSAGIGDPDPTAWMAQSASLEAVLARFAQETDRLGPYLAYQIARDAVRLDVMLVSDLDPAQVAGLKLRRAPCLHAAVIWALCDLRPDTRIAVLPRANATLPLRDT